MGWEHFTPKRPNHWLYRSKLSPCRQLSWGKLRGKPDTWWLDWSFATTPTYHERFARQ